MFSVLNAAGEPVAGAKVTVNGSAGVTDTKGVAVLALPATGKCSVKVEEVHHLPVGFEAAVTGGGHMWDDPGTDVLGKPGSAIVNVRLGRLRAAPTERVRAGSMAMSAGTSALVSKGLADDEAAYQRARRKNPNA